MKNTVVLLLMLFSTMNGWGQVNPTTALLGAWWGKLQAGAIPLTLVLHLEQADGYVTAALDSPDQAAKGISALKEYLSDDSVALNIEAIGARFRAKLVDGQLKGTFVQRGFSFPLVLKPGEPVQRRPQQPAPPYPYATEEVTFCNASDSATLAGTLTWPAGYDKRSGQQPTVVLMVTGSGQQNRDEEIFGHKPFLVIADYLARQGIASLRYDDRATGASEGGELFHATTADFMRDAAAGVDFLRRTGAFGKIGILGHSEGGAIAFMLGAQQKVDYVVSMAAPGVKGDTLLTAQGNRIRALSLQPNSMTVEQYRQMNAVRKNPWLKWFVDYDPADDIRNTRCPVFALNGDRDCQVIAKQNLSAIRQLLPPSAKNLVKEYPSLNHLFQHCTIGLPSEYGQIEETIATEVLSDIAQWINSIK